MTREHAKQLITVCTENANLLKALAQDLWPTWERHEESIRHYADGGEVEHANKGGFWSKVSRPLFLLEIAYRPVPQTTLDDLKEGDLIEVDATTWVNATTCQILGMCGKVVFVSRWDDYEAFSFTTTIAKLKKQGWKIVKQDK